VEIATHHVQDGGRACNDKILSAGEHFIRRVGRFMVAQTAQGNKRDARRIR
jgi:hypothetical protein